jgi:uncharacterized membrane protein YbhN (UPF0104 family)
MKKRTLKKVGKFLLKLIFSFILLYVVFTKIDFEDVAAHLKYANYTYIIGAFLSIATAQAIGGLRMRYLFKIEGLSFSRLYAISFYYIGMLFNLVLPGGIGGDGYKAYYFYKRFHFAWKKSVLVVIRGRANGLLFLFLFLFMISFSSERLMSIPYGAYYAIAGLIFIPICYTICARYLLKETFSMQVGAFNYSITAQLFFLLATLLILRSIGNFENYQDYLIVFLVANIVAIIPISFGGFGLRELTFVSFSGVIGIDAGAGVAVSLLFYVLYSITALLGLLPLYKLAWLDMKQLEKIRKEREAISILPASRKI